VRKSLRVVSDKQPVGKIRRFLISLLSLVLVVSIISIIAPQPAIAATVTATGSNPSVCNQTVDVLTGVTAERIANGDCLVKFSSATTVNLTIPAGVTSGKVLIIGGGGGGGGGGTGSNSCSGEGSTRVGGGGGGGGGGQVKDNLSISGLTGTLAITVGSGGAAGAAASCGAAGAAGGTGGTSSVTISGGSQLANADGGSGGGGGSLNGSAGAGGNSKNSSGTTTTGGTPLSTSSCSSSATNGCFAAGGGASSSGNGVSPTLNGFDTNGAAGKAGVAVSALVSATYGGAGGGGNRHPWSPPSPLSRTGGLGGTGGGGNGNELGDGAAGSSFGGGGGGGRGNGAYDLTSNAGAGGAGYGGYIVFSYTPAAVPSAPSIGTAAVTNSTTVSIPFTAGAANGSAITSYTITSSPSIALTYSGTTSPISATGSFVGGQAYTFSITATNGVGTSSSSSASNSIRPNTTLSISYAAGTDGSGSAPLTPTTVSYGSTFTTPANTYSRSGYSFAGWNDGSATYAAGVRYPSSGTASANVALTATWSANTNNAITYDNAGATTAQSGGSTTYTTAAAIATIPTVAPLKTGYTFNGWFTAASGGSQVTNASYTPASPYGGVTIYAQWSANVYTITFDSNTATSGSVPSNQSYTVGTTFTKPGNSGSLAKPGWIFTGWLDSNGTFVTSSYLPTASTTFSARWEANQYLILYDAYDGRGWWRSSWHSSDKAPVTLLVPTRNGMTFNGWFNLGVGSRLGDASNSYLTYTPNMACNNYPICNTIWAGARWTANTYTISFDSNTAASGSAPGNLSWTGGQVATALPNSAGSLTKPFYNFGGWSATAGGSTRVNYYSAAADKTFYAIWTPISYKVTYNTNGGPALSPNNATSTAGSLITLPTPTRTGYTPTGWWSAATGGVKIGDVGATYQPTSAKYLYAQWRRN